MGLLPCRQSLQRLRLTILLERRMRGDLIGTFKIFNGFVNYGHNMFGTTSHHLLRSAHDFFNKSYQILEPAATTRAKFKM